MLAKILTLLFGLLLFGMSAAAAGAVSLLPEGQAKAVDGIWRFPDENSRVVQSGSAKCGASAKGLTISAAVRLKKRPPVSGSGIDSAGAIVFQHDIIASKEGDFVFGRRSDAWVDQMYCNFRVGGKWLVPLKLGAKTPPYDCWAVWSVTLLPQVRREEGVSSTIITFYLNGEQLFRQEVPGIPELSKSPVRWGQGQGIDGQLYGFQGEMAEMQLLDRALNEDEVAALAAGSKLVKISGGSNIALTPEFTAALAPFAGKSGLWLRSVLTRAAKNGFPQEDLTKTAAALYPLSAVAPADLPERFPAGMPLVLRRCGRMLALIWTGRGQGIFPLFGLYDLTAGREVFGRETWGWHLTALDGREFASAAPWHCTADKDCFRCTWELPGGGAVICRLNLAGEAVTCTAEIRNPDSKLVLQDFTFPAVRLAALKQGTDYLLHPRQSGVLYPHPVVASVPVPSCYPRGALNMQFDAYFDDVSGIYFSPEDPKGKVMFHQIRGRGGDLELLWRCGIPRKPDKTGGNSLPETAPARLVCFTGDWYDAAMIYRDFAFTRAEWTKKRQRPVPKWFAENPLWLSHWTFTEQDIREMPALFRSLREFLELPLGVHWYRWYDTDKGGMPHFIPKIGVPEAVAELKQAGVYPKCYIDTRLWSEQDGPGRLSVAEFEAIGRRCAVINADGTMNYERYRRECREVVMCPGAAAWRRKMNEVTAGVAQCGFAAVYHDQVSASTPFLCFAPGHGHLLNDPSVWNNGYLEMFREISQLSRRYPDLVHDTEDAAEVHLPIFDGFLTWRWLDSGQVPLFAAVYGGSTQFTGRSFDQSSKGDADSFYAKLAVQLLNGEQPGWFTIGQLQTDPERAAFVKRVAHLRHELLSYFNGGRMLRPPVWAKKPAAVVSLWGSSSTTPERLVLPAILSAAWQDPQGRSVMLLVNFTSLPAAGVLKPASPLLLCRAGVEPQTVSGTLELKLSAREIVLLASDRAEADRLKTLLDKIAAFDGAPLLGRFGVLAPGGGNFDCSRTGAEHVAADTDGFTVSGVPQRTIHCKIKMALRPECRYRLTAQLCIKQSTGYLAVANYSRDNKLKFYGVAGNKVPADGQWHPVLLEFSTDRDLCNCGLFTYNRGGAGEVSLKNLKLIQIK